ncbi:O-antigen ligase family protein [Desulfogranum mediterraneum]|uniref:O-antigen ligase family protein n=1 Tax=Desulfogranum mediterraneum TaxID=160661 RepID=UPI0004266D9E|nr:O-antigen ligase family protein [Desulfogranum mediterraneum]
MVKGLFFLWTFVLIARPQDFFYFIAPFRPALVLTLIVFFAAALSVGLKDASSFKNSAQLKRYLFLYAVMALGVPFSIHRGVSFDFILFQVFPNLLFFYVSVLLISSRRDLENFIFCVCCANFFYVGLGLLTSSGAQGRFQFGSMYDANDLAYFLISTFPLSFYYLSKNEALFKRAVAFVSVVFSIAVSVMTGSRGGLLGLGTVLLLVLFSRWSPLKLIHRILFVIILIVGVTVNLDKIDVDRFGTLLNAETDYNITSESGRLSIWKTALKLTMTHPFTGVGVGCFANAIGSYRQEIGEIPRWQAPHNSFVQLLTEVGLVGFCIFLSMVSSAMMVFLRCARGDSPILNVSCLAPVGRVIFIAFLGNLVTSFFLSMAYSILLTLFFAFSFILQNLMEREAGGVAG